MRRCPPDAPDGGVFAGGGRGEAIAVLSRQIRDGEALLLLTGGAGIGKSAVLKAVLETLADDPVRVISLSNPDTSSWSLHRLSQQLPVKPAAALTDQAISLAARALIAETKAQDQRATARDGEARVRDRILIAVDDAQTLTDAALECLLLLASPALGADMTIQVVLSGRDVFWERPWRMELRLLTSLATLVTLAPLSRADSVEYIVHCLRRRDFAAAKAAPETIEAIASRARGNPEWIEWLLMDVDSAPASAPSRILTAGAVKAALPPPPSLKTPLFQRETPPLPSAMAFRQASAREPDIETGRPPLPSMRHEPSRHEPPRHERAAIGVPPPDTFPHQRDWRMGMVVLILAGGLVLMHAWTDISFTGVAESPLPRGSAVHASSDNASPLPADGDAREISPVSTRRFNMSRASPEDTALAPNEAGAREPPLSPSDHALAVEEGSMKNPASTPGGMTRDVTRDVTPLTTVSGLSPRFAPRGKKTAPAAAGNFPSSSPIMAAQVTAQVEAAVKAADPLSVAWMSPLTMPVLTGPAAFSVPLETAAPSPDAHADEAASLQALSAPVMAARTDNGAAVPAEHDGGTGTAPSPPAVTRADTPRTRAPSTMPRTESPLEMARVMPEPLASGDDGPLPRPLPGAVSPRPSPSATPLSPDAGEELIRRGEALLRQGDIVSARLYFERAAASGNGRAATWAGKTHDPVFLLTIGVRGPRGDAFRAIEWYRKAATQFGDSEARERLDDLLSRPSP